MLWPPKFKNVYSQSTVLQFSGFGSIVKSKSGKFHHIAELLPGENNKNINFNQKYCEFLAIIFIIEGTCPAGI
jgi:hypothetical protein